MVAYKSIWIEAEQWASGELNIIDDNTDVIVQLDDDSKWVSSFFTYSNIATLTQRYKTSGECLHGKYFWASDMILIDMITRPRITEIVQSLLREGIFHKVFSPIEKND